MGPIFFAARDSDEPVKVSFIHNEMLNMYQPKINDEMVPILLEVCQTEDAVETIYQMKKNMEKKKFKPPVEFLSQIIRGACRVCMKWHM